MQGRGRWVKRNADATAVQVPHLYFDVVRFAFKMFAKHPQITRIWVGVVVWNRPLAVVGGHQFFYNVPPTSLCAHAQFQQARQCPVIFVTAVVFAPPVEKNQGKGRFVGHLFV